MNLHDILVSIKLAKACVNDNKFQFSINDIKIVSYICNFNNMHFKIIKIIKIIDWSSCISLYKT